MKTAMEFLVEKAHDGNYDHYPSMYRQYNYQEVCGFMEEYASLYHKEKMREELIKYAGTIFVNASDAEMIVDDYLKSLEK